MCIIQSKDIPSLEEISFYIEGVEPSDFKSPSDLRMGSYGAGLPGGGRGGSVFLWA